MSFFRILDEEKAPAAAAASARARLLQAVDRFDWAAWERRAAKVLNAQFRQLVKTAGQKTGRDLGILFNNEDPFVQRRLTNYVGDRIVELNRVTRDEVKDVIRRSLEEGFGTTGELGKLVRDAVRERFAGYEDWRADRIARTETAIAENYGFVFGARQAGVEDVVVSDGDGDVECAAVDGTTQTLEWALDNPVAHPNCTRAFSAVEPGDESKSFKYSPDQARDYHGRFGEGGADSRSSDRSKRAIEHFKPSTKAKQDHADRSEGEVSRMLGGKGTGDNKPIDTVVRIGTRTHGVEVKTFVDNTNDKITMHPKSRMRKEKWATQNKAILHTVVIDKRDLSGNRAQYSGHRVYYRRGVGSFRLDKMTKVQNPAHLRKLMTE